MPLVWGVSLAHYMPFLGGEAGSLLPATAHTFGLTSLSAALPHVALAPSVTAFVQSALFVVGGASSAGLCLKIGHDGQQPAAAVAAQVALMTVALATLWPLLITDSWLL